MTNARVMTERARRGVGRAEDACWAFLAYEVFLLWYLAVPVLDRVKQHLAAQPGATAATIGFGDVIRSFGALFGVVDGVLLAIGVLVVFGAVVVEVKARAVSSYFETVLASGPATLVLLLLLSTAFCVSYLGPGLILEGDASSHVSQVVAVARSIRSGEGVPFWSNYWYLGSPSLQFAGPLFFWLGGAAAAVSGSYGGMLWALKLLLLTLHLTSGVAVYYLVTRLFASSLNVRPAALLAGVYYVASFAHTHLIFLNGAFPQALVLLLFPLCLVFLAETLQTPSPGAIPGLALCYSLLLMAHPGMGIYTGYFLGAWAIAWGMALRTHRAIARAAVAGALGAIAGSYVLLPTLFEMSYVYYGGTPPLPNFDFSGFVHVVRWTRSFTGPGSNPYFYLGVSGLLLAAYGALTLIRRDRRLGLLLSISLVASLCVTAPTMRNAAFNLLFVAVLAGYGVISFLRGRAPRQSVVVGGLLLIVVTVDLLPTSIQPLFRPDKQFLADMGARLETLDTRERVLEVTEDGLAWRCGIGPGGPPLLGFRVPTLFGPHNLTAPHTHNYAAALADSAVARLGRNKGFDTATLDTLYLLNVRYLLFATPRGYVVPDALGLREEGASDYSVERSLPAVVIRRASPVVFAPAVFAVDPRVLRPFESRLLWNTDDAVYRRQIAATADFVQREVIGPMELDRERGVARQIAIRGNVSTSRATREHPDFSLLEFDLRETSLRARVRAATDGYLQFAYAFYPLLDVRVDGRSVDPIESATSLLVVPVRAGQHEIEIRSPLSGLRIATLAAFGIGLAVLTWAFISRRRNTWMKASL